MIIFVKFTFFLLYHFSEPLKDAGCVSNDQCSPLEACQNRVCVNPCASGSPCAQSAECKVQNHLAVCSCPPGYVGDPFRHCFIESIVPKPECVSDSECSPSTACINQRCQNPCAERNPCTANAECRVTQHHPTCYCPPEWAGDPQLQCYKRKFLFYRSKYVSRVLVYTKNLGVTEPLNKN